MKVSWTELGSARGEGVDKGLHSSAPREITPARAGRSGWKRTHSFLALGWCTMFDTEPLQSFRNGSRILIVCGIVAATSIVIASAEKHIHGECEIHFFLWRSLRFC